MMLIAEEKQLFFEVPYFPFKEVGRRNGRWFWRLGG